MLVIRKEQMEVFRAHFFEQFVGRVSAHLREAFSTQCGKMDENGLRQIIREGIARAGQYGVTSEFDVWRYVDLMFFYGRNFDAAFPVAISILEDQDLNGNEKVNRLYAELGAVAEPEQFEVNETELIS